LRRRSGKSDNFSGWLKTSRAKPELLIVYGLSLAGKRPIKGSQAASTHNTGFLFTSDPSDCFPLNFSGNKVHSGSSHDWRLRDFAGQKVIKST